MVNPKRSRQSWWQLYALALIMIGLLILAHYLAPSPGWRTFLDIGVVVLGYGVITVWVEAHSTVLLRRPPAEPPSQIVELLEGEMSSLTSPSIQFYAGSDTIIIYEMPEHLNEDHRSNGHRPIRSFPSLPEEISNN